MTGFRALVTGQLLTAETSREGDRVTTLELFFDLVYVFAFTQVTQLMSHGHSAESVLQGLAVLALIWWSWTSFAWLTNQAHADHGVVRVGIMLAIAIMFIVSLVIPESFDDLEGGLFAPMVFVVGITLVSIVHAVVYWIAAGTDAALRRQILRSVGITIVPVLALTTVGALIGGPWQAWIWLGTALLQGVIIFVTSHGGDWRIYSMAHFSERHGLIVILALGESVVATGVGVAELAISVPIIVGSLFAITLAVAMWWNYFHHLSSGVEHALRRRKGRDRVDAATDVYTYLHPFVVAGIIIVALGVEQGMHHVESPEAIGYFAAWALGGGLSLYLATTGFIWARVSGQWSLLRFGAAVLALVLVPVIAEQIALVALPILVVVSVLLAVLEEALGPRAKVRRRQRPGTAADARIAAAD
ncbi:low temperature requirement protein A [Leifsonia flava]|uniref:Low temperature requirement protein A n=1 Tax=Orlajensenia leifsoniae TaxID=2561933 RepID=A0A4Y9RB84_9MICO|nr:low temperature requirement protein A [Leifsonia flava]TFW00337.1 low temperature requirement protein A [Leifsonia flava]